MKGIINNIIQKLNGLLGRRSPVTLAKHGHAYNASALYSNVICLDLRQATFESNLCETLSKEFKLVNAVTIVSADFRSAQRNKSANYKHVDVLAVEEDYNNGGSAVLSSTVDVGVYIHRTRKVEIQKTNSASYYISFEDKEKTYVDELILKVYSPLSTIIPVIDNTVSRMFILVKDRDGLYFRVFNLQANNPKYVKADYKYNYTGDVLDKYRSMRDNIIKGKSGLYLMHGPPGCGKSALIYRLVDEIKSKHREYRVLYITPDMTRNIGSPEFTNAILDIKEYAEGPTVLILEDTGEFIAQRDDRLPATVALLNLTDGLLSVAAGAGLSIIITYNNEDITIDSAITRSGRCLGHTYIGNLSEEETDEWCEYHKLQPLSMSMCLADLYDYKESASSGDTLDRELEGSLD